MNKLIHKNIKIVLVVIVTVFFSFNIKLTAQTKNTIEYKTSIIDQNQKPMLDGTYNFRFALYNVSNGGSALWSEDRFGVQVRRAAISVDLGAFVPFPQNLFKNTSLYLQVCMDANLAGGDGSGECSGGFEENFKPRKIVTGVPWAYNATSLGPVAITTGQTAYNLDTTGSDGNLLNLNFNDIQRFTITTGGNVGIGIATPAYPLDVFGTGNFTNGIIVGDNPNPIAGAIRFNSGNFEGFNGTSWIPFGGGAAAAVSPVTDDGAGLDYLTNTANSFAIGGSTSAAPFYFNPLTGALIRRNTILQNDPANIMQNMLTLDSSGANAQVGGNKNGITGIFAYTPSGGTGAEIYNTQESTLVINAGDGTNINRVRGYRNTIVNNSSGTVDGAFNLSTINTNNGTEQFQTGYNSTLINNGTLTGQMVSVSANVTNSGDSGVFTIGASANATNTVGSVTDQLTASYNQTTNDGTTDYQYGSRNVVNNNGTVNITLYALLNGVENAGTVPVMYGIQTSATNLAPGIVNSDSFGIQNTSSNAGTVNASLYGLYNIVSNTGTVLGDTVGLLSSDGVTTTRLNYNGAYAIDTQGGAVRFSNQAIVGNSTGTDEAGAIRFNGGTFEGFDGGTWNSLGGSGFSQWGDTGGGDIFFDTGFVGIQTNAPATDLDVNGFARISSGLGVGQLNDGAYALEVAGAGQFANEVVVGNSLVDATGAIRFNGVDFEGYNGTSWNTLGAGAGSSQWLDNGADIYFDAGSVGIGSTSSGTFTLEVTGTAYTTGNLRTDGQLTVNTAPGAFTFEVNGTSGFDSDAQFFGAVGIGTAPNGAYALNIAGDVNINGVVTFLQGFDAGGTINFNGGTVTVSGGDLNVTNNNLIVTNGAICADGGTGCPALTPGTVYGDLAYVEFDVAENILANQDVEAGDLVSGLNGQSEVVRKTEIANEGTLLGVISTNPGSLGGFSLEPRDGFKVMPFVLSGRVPVKVSTENGHINVGDPITSSSAAGVGMKATDSKVKIVGYAMQAYNSAGVGKIVVLFQPGYLP